jgi:Cdc6-like AAA superfamily ATPase
MGFKPQDITKEHILSAVKRIDQENIQLIEPTKYHVVINGKKYPPKEIMRYAHEQMNGERVWENDGGDPTNKYLENFGFTILGRDIDYSWVQAHKQIVQRLKNYRNKQEELIDILEEAGVERSTLIDENESGERVRLSEIDPYDFFCFIHKYGDERRLEILRNIAGVFEIEKPEDVHGIPTTNAQKAMMFPFRSNGRTNEVNQLWELFEQQLSNTITNGMFQAVLSIKGIGEAKLTEALFNVDPENNLPINAQTRPFLQEKFGLGTDIETYNDYLEILEQVRSKSKLSFARISHEAWLWNTGRITKNYWVGACIWGEGKDQVDKTKEFLNNGFWKTGYDLINNDQGKRIAKLLNKVQVGDRLAIRYFTRNTGNIELTGIGTVISIESVKDGELSIDWDVRSDLYNGPKPEGRGAGNWWETLIQLKRKKDIELIFGQSLDESNKKQKDQSFMDQTTETLNQILYGPPGTGKTFYTVNKALQIVDPEFYESNKKDRQALTKRYRELLITDWAESKKRRIAFTTFHQSFTYEDFVEGIKPDVNTEGELSYKIEDGIFKRICRKAKYYSEGEAEEARERVRLSDEDFKKAQFFKVSLGNTNKEEDDEIYQYCMENGKISVGYLDHLDLSEKSESEIKEVVLESSGLSNFSSRAMNYFIHYLKKGHYVLVSKGNSIVRAIGQVKGDYEYKPDAPISYPHFRDVDWLVKDVEIPIEEIYEKNLQQQPIYMLKKDWVSREFFEKQNIAEVAEGSNENFVLIIDEINRGNIAQIFGELITLIESDKREGGKEEQKAILPYSKKPFSVPSNLHIIGTMNTADRSIEALDTALRRRFTFEEMPPKSKVIEEEGSLKEEKSEIRIGESYFLLSNILETINKRVEKLLDKDHLIGHSYFMSVKEVSDLQRVFYRNIIPLLEEYFYGDKGKIQLVLGQGFIKQAEHSGETDLFAQSDYDDSIFEDREVWELSKRWRNNEEAFEEVLNMLLNIKA